MFWNKCKHDYRWATMDCGFYEVSWWWCGKCGRPQPRTERLKEEIAKKRKEAEDERAGTGLSA